MAAPQLCMDGSGFVHAFGGVHNDTAGMVYASTPTARNNSFTTRQITSSVVSTGFAYLHPYYINSSNSIFLYLRRSTTSGSNMPLIVKVAASPARATWGSDISLADIVSDRVNLGQTCLGANGTDVYLPFILSDFSDTAPFNATWRFTTPRMARCATSTGP